MVTGEHVLPPDQRVRVTVKRHGQGLAQRPVKPKGDPLAQLGRGLAAKGQDEHATWVDAAARHPLDDGLHDRRGLAGARTGKDQQRAAGVLDDAALGVIEAWRGGRRLGWRTSR